MLFSFFHNFFKLKLVTLFSRLISFFPIFNRVMKNYKKLPIDPTPTPPPTLTRTTVRCPLTRERESGTWEMGVREGGTSWVGGTLRGGEGVDVRSWSKMLFLDTFWKITTYWPPLDERVAKVRFIIYKI